MNAPRTSSHPVLIFLFLLATTGLLLLATTGAVAQRATLVQEGPDTLRVDVSHDNPIVGVELALAFDPDALTVRRVDSLVTSYEALHVNVPAAQTAASCTPTIGGVGIALVTEIPAAGGVAPVEIPSSVTRVLRITFDGPGCHGITPAAEGCLYPSSPPGGRGYFRNIVTDTSGNSVSLTFDSVTLDSEAPSWDVPPPASASVVASGDTVTYSLPSASATDGCSSGAIVSVVDADGSTFSPGDAVTLNCGATHSFTYVAADAFGNLSPLPHAVEVGCTGLLRGDINGDGFHDVSDTVSLLLSLFGGLDGPECMDSADADDDGLVQVNDAIYLLNWRYSTTGSPPPPPFVSCGPDPTADSLDCVSSPPCV